MLVKIAIKIIIILFLASLNLCNGQNINKIKSADTLYMYYTGKKGESKTINIISRNSKIAINRNFRIDTLINYKFILNKEYYLESLTSKYLNFDDYEINKPADIKIVDCMFLKTHKDFIMSSKFIKNNIGNATPDEIYTWVNENIKNKKKTFYLIDRQERKNGKIVLREINPFIQSYEPPWNDIEPFEIEIINTDSIKN